MPEDVREGHLGAEAGQQRRLATIMFTDMVGYSALAQQHEALALQLLDEQRAILRAAFAECGGREIEAVGDGFFVEFPSALSAAPSAVAIQQRLAELNRAAASGTPIRVRIGLHVGDVVVRDKRVHGDVVNIAARIEPLAPPGGICVSEDVARQIQNKIDLPLRKLGKGELKNIRLPVDIYRLVLPGERRHLPFWEQVTFGFRQQRTRRLTIGIMAVALVAMLTGAGVHLWQRGKDSTKNVAMGRNRIAVLPFTNISTDANDEYFADGMTEELISRLSRIRGLEVIARTSVMKYKGTQKDIADIGRELNVGTVLEGSVRKASNRLRITAQLIGVGTQAHLWSQDYDRQLADVFIIQSEIAQRVADALRVRLLPGEGQPVAGKGTENLEAYNLYLRGLYGWNKQTKDGLEQGKTYFEQAINKDRTYAQAHAMLAFSYNNLGWNGLLSKKDAFPKAKAAALRALELDDTNIDALTVLGIMKVFDWDWPGADRAFERVLSLNPSAAFGHETYSLLYLVPMGRYEEAIAEMKRAMELDPLFVLYHSNLGWVLYLSGRYDQAIEQFQRVIELEPNITDTYRGLGEVYATQGRHEESVRAMQKLVDLSGRTSYALASLGWAYGVAGKRGEALKVLEMLKEKSKPAPPDASDFTRVYLGLGEKDQAIAWLQKAYADGYDSWLLIWAKPFPFFDPIRSDSRFIELLKKVGLER